MMKGSVELGQRAIIVLHVGFGGFAQIGWHRHQCRGANLAGVSGKFQRHRQRYTLHAYDKRHPSVNRLCGKLDDTEALGIAQRKKLACQGRHNQTVGTGSHTVVDLRLIALPVDFAIVTEGRM